MPRRPTLALYRSLSGGAFKDRLVADIVAWIVFAPMDYGNEIDALEIFDRIVGEVVRHHAVDRADEEVALELLKRRVSTWLAARHAALEAELSGTEPIAGALAQCP